MTTQAEQKPLQRPLQETRRPHCGQPFPIPRMKQQWEAAHPERFNLAGTTNIKCPWRPLRPDVERPEAYPKHARLAHPAELGKLS